MTATTRSVQSTGSGPTLYAAFELGSTKWVLGFASSPAQRARVRTIRAGALEVVTQEIALAKTRFGLPMDAPVQSCYEAGRDGFWLHRWLIGMGTANVVVDASSIEVNRRARRAKTDRLDVGRLVQLLMRWAGGERKVWSVVHVPTVEAEDARQAPRELATVREDRKRVRNRIQSLLAAQGAALTLTRAFLTQLAQQRTGDGHVLSPALRARLEGEWAHLQIIEQRLRALRLRQTDAISGGTDRVAEVARRLCRLRGIAERGAALLSAEVLGTREFANGRQLGALLGLVPTPYRSDQQVREQGISKAGRAELRRTAVQLSWGWVRWQRQSALSQWFLTRFGPGGGRSRRIGIVAVARKLMIALWHFVVHGVIPLGATLKPVAA